MKYFSGYVDNKLKVRCFEEDGSQDHLIPEGFEQITEAQANVLLEPDVVVESLSVDTERDRRLLRFKHNGMWYQSRPMDRVRIAGAHTAALACIMTNGEWPSDFAWIAEDDTHIPMTLQQVLEFGNTALNHERTHIFAANALKTMEPIPLDYEDDSYWPASPV